MDDRVIEAINDRVREVIRELADLLATVTQRLGELERLEAQRMLLIHGSAGLASTEE